MSIFNLCFPFLSKKSNKGNDSDDAVQTIDYDVNIEEFYEDACNSSYMWAEEGCFIIKSPIKGRADYIENTPDSAFAKRMLGDGIMIHPSGSQVVAPFDGIVTTLFDTHNAISLTSNEGIELLIHVGIDTARFHGNGFTPFVKNGDRVVTGQKLLEFDRNHIRANAISDATPIVITNMQPDWGLELLAIGNVNELDNLMKI